MHYTCEAVMNFLFFQMDSRLGCKNSVRFQNFHNFPAVIISMEQLEEIRRSMAGACLQVQGQPGKGDEMRLGRSLQTMLGGCGVVPGGVEAAEPCSEERKEETKSYEPLEKSSGSKRETPAASTTPQTPYPIPGCILYFCHLFPIFLPRGLGSLACVPFMSVFGHLL